MTAELEANLEARLRLALARGVGPTISRRLVDHCGSADAACAASVAELQEVEGIGRRKGELIRRALDEADAAGEWQTCREHGVDLLSIDDDGYPPLLRHIPDPPGLLYVRGRLERGDNLALGVVGSRRCSAYGREQADRLAALCAQAGLVIISGGARGVDTAAHRATLRVGGRTIAVLGCGLAECYPPENDELFEQVAAGGALISELPLHAPPVPENFPRRNRIISGLSLGILVIEADARSGALITARLAAEEHHREVMALPGRVDARTSTGCHRAIREGWATLVTSSADVLDALGEAGQTLKAALGDDGLAADAPTDTRANLPAAQGQLLEVIGRDAVEIDAVCRQVEVEVGQVQSHLMQMQLAGLIERLPGNRVRRRS